MILQVLLLLVNLALSRLAYLSDRTLLSAYLFLPILHLTGILSGRPFPLGPVELLFVATAHILIAMHLCYSALPEGEERRWLMALGGLVGLAFSLIVIDAGFKTPVWQDVYYVLTMGVMVAAAIGGTTAAYIACFRGWKRLPIPLLVTVYFAVDGIVNAIWKNHPFDRALWSTLSAVDHAVHLLVVSIALWLLRCETSAKNAPLTPAHPEPDATLHL